MMTGAYSTPYSQSIINLQENLAAHAVRSTHVCKLASAHILLSLLFNT